MNSIIEIKNLTKCYASGHGKLEVIKGVNLTINTGDFISIQGASGSGKSTFLNLLGGLDKYDSGDIIVEGKSLQEFYSFGTIDYYRNNYLSFIFQNHYLMADFTILENVMLPLIIKDEKTKTAKILAKDMLEKVGLADRSNHYPNQISGGESQRVAVARALVARPPLILADEPTGNLDSGNTANFIEILNELQAQYKLTIVMVTHEKDLAKTAQRQFNMVDGNLIKL